MSKELSEALLVDHLRRSLDHYIGEPETAESVRSYLQRQIDLVQGTLPEIHRTKIGKVTKGPDGSWCVMVAPAFPAHRVHIHIDVDITLEKD